MVQSTRQVLPGAEVEVGLPAGLDITVRTGSAAGATPLSAFDHALERAGVADFNLVTLSSVIPPRSRVRVLDADLPGGHGDLLFCVRAQAFAEEPGETVWAGLGWCMDETGGGLFVEHRGATERDLLDQIEQSLDDMNRRRGGRYGPVQTAVASARCTDRPACALVLAAYRVSSWHEPEPRSEAPSRASEADVPQGTRVEAAAASEVAAPAPRPPAPRKEATPVQVTLEQAVDVETAQRFYTLYREAFGELETTAVARQVLHESEFVEEMLDARVSKYVARDEHGEAIGMSTLTSDLETVPWISPAYFAHHYPEHHRRGAIYYMGFTLVHPAHRGAGVYHAMFRPMIELLIGERAVVAADICMVNDERGLGGNGIRLLDGLADVTTVPIDRQTYYAATFRGPLAERDAE